MQGSAALWPRGLIRKKASRRAVGIKSCVCRVEAQAGASHSCCCLEMLCAPLLVVCISMACTWCIATCAYAHSHCSPPNPVLYDSAAAPSVGPRRTPDAQGVCRMRHICACSRLLPLTSSVILTEVTSNTIFMAGMCAWGIAQVAKVFTHKFKKGKWDVLQVVASGGMPSSHSSLCMVRAPHCTHGSASLCCMSCQADIGLLAPCAAL